MTTEQVAEIVSGLLKERRLPDNAVNVLGPDQNNLLIAVRFGAQVETQCFVDAEWESREALVERLGKWLDIQARAARAQRNPEA